MGIIYNFTPNMKKLKPILEESKNGFPDPIKAKCFQCKKSFWTKFVVPQRSYSKKNDWGYFTGRKEDKGKHKCNSCLRSFYYDKKTYWETIPNLKKRAVLAYYVSKQLI